MRQFMHVAIAAIKHLFNSPTDAFWTGRAMDLLVDGILIDCNTTNPMAKVACTQIQKMKNPQIRSIDTKRMKFSYLAGVRLMFLLFSAPFLFHSEVFVYL